MAVKRREVKSKEKMKDTSRVLNAEFQKIARRDRKSTQRNRGKKQNLTTKQEASQQ